MKYLLSLRSSLLAACCLATWECAAQERLLNPDFAAYAEACGGVGIRVGKPDELKGAVERAMSLQVPVIIDVDTDPRRFP